MNIVRRTTVPHVGLWGPANPVPVGIWPDRRQSPQLILCGPGTESPPGITDTSWPLILAPHALQSCQCRLKVRTEDQDVIQVYQTLEPGVSLEYPLHQSLEYSGSIHQPEGHYPKFIDPSLRDECRLFSFRGVHLHLPVSTSQVEATDKQRVLRLSSMCGSG